MIDRDLTIEVEFAMLTIEFPLNGDAGHETKQSLYVELTERLKGSDPSLLEAFRKQCEFTKEPYGVLLLWWNEQGVDRDDLVDIAHDVGFKLADESR